MIEVERDNLRLLTFASLSGDGMPVHAVTTKPCNLAPHRGPDRDRAVENRRRVCASLNLDFEQMTAASQIHGADLLVVSDADIGRGRDGRESAVPFVDGLITDRPGVALLSLSADCPSILAFDSVSGAIGVVHASWRGILAGAGRNIIAQMRRAFDCDPANMQVGIGPSAGPCCYEVGEDLRRVAATRISDVSQLIPRRNGKFYFDMWQALTQQLVDAGISQDAIEVSGHCTICDERFYSHRREGPATGRIGLICALPPERSVAGG